MWSECSWLLIALAAVCTLDTVPCATTTILRAPVSMTTTTTTHNKVRVDTTMPGPRFDGLGGCSAGTGPRLLVDYPEPARQDLLDLLFLPNHGASLQILKVEIGGQGDSSTGTEASHEPSKGIFNWDSGYEWFMMAEAVRRNPDILIYGLAWSFPSWLYAGTNHSTCHDDWVGCVNGTAAAAYIADWVEGARQHHNLTVDYVGFHNEHPWRPEWVLALRADLDARGLNTTRIVVGDCGPGGSFQSPGLPGRLADDKELSAAADIVGLHYPVSILPVDQEPTGPGMNRAYYEQLWALPGHQKLWASEEYSTYSDGNGARCLAKLVNRNYVDANLTALVVWDMVWAWMDGLACSGQGMIWAAEPWSGAIGLVDTVWSIAHTSQVTRPGWRYLRKSGPWGPGGAGYLPPSSATPPAPSSCPGGTFPANASGLQCSGLSPRGYGTAHDCAAACCADPHCSVWQWAPTGSPGGSGCWLGRSGSPPAPASCSPNAAWVGGMRTPPVPLPGPTRCASSRQFPANASHVQCGGLEYDAAAATSNACAINCCNDQRCSVWQWGTGAGGGCWRGTCTSPPVSNSAWIGGSRIAPSPPPPPPPPPPPIGGTYVGFVSSNALDADVSLVVETMNNADSECAYGNAGWGEVPDGRNTVEFCLSSHVCVHHRRLHVRFSALGNLTVGAPRFQRREPVDLLPAAAGGGGDCCFTAELERNAVYSFSTRNDTAKGAPSPGTRVSPKPPEGAGRGCGAVSEPLSSPFPMPYSTTFAPEQVRFSDFPEFLSDVQGVFRVTKDPFATTPRYHDGSTTNGNTTGSGYVLKQRLTMPRSISYAGGYGQSPMSLLGSKLWENYTVETVARSNVTQLNATIALYGRTGLQYAFGSAGGYALFVSVHSGAWSLRTGGSHDTVLANGTHTLPAGNGWVQMQLTMVGNDIRAQLNGNEVARVTDDSYTHGFAALGCGWHEAWFREFHVRLPSITAPQHESNGPDQ